ncbi:MAG: efflux RND transporter periplasmic adaptor subunit [Planctomycetota bacterium]|jgi:RND family efflux transporter MFP subunit
MRSIPRPVLVSLLLLTAALLPWCPDARSDEVEGVEAPTTLVVTPGPFRELLELQGSLVPRGAVEVAYDPEVYGGALEITSAIGPGRVVKGQSLVEFDDEAITRQIDDARRDLEIAELKFAKQEDGYQRRKEETAIELARAEMRRRLAEEELELFRTVHKPTRIETAEFNLEGTEHRIKDQVEELEQLEKMYLADDLTEETEEIVLRRARRGLERSRRSFDFAKRRHQLFLEVTLPREEEELVLKLRQQENAYAALKATAELSLRQAKIELDKARTALERQRETLQKLQADRDALHVKAPVAGYAVPGYFAGGKWVKMEETRRALREGGKVSARQVLYTIVQPGHVGIHCTVGESDLLDVRIGQSATAEAAVIEDSSLAAKVSSVLPVGSGGKHEVLLDLQETEEGLMPGQGVTVMLEIRREEQALTVPKSAVKRDGKKTLVFLWVDGEAEAREVEVGATSEGKVEILDGLEAGDIVLERVPEDA